MKKLLSFILLFVFLAPVSLYSLPVEDASALLGSSYFPEVKKLISSAETSIYACMYIATYYPDIKGSLSNQLIDELINAHKRGVAVKVILEQKRTYASRGRYNDLAYTTLKSAGVPVYFDNPVKKLHDKLIIIDNSIIVIGSHNWSKYALQENSESSVVIRSPELAKDFIKWIDDRQVSPPCVPVPQIDSKAVYLPYKFLTDKGLGAGIAEKRFMFYLYLLKKWEESGHNVIMLDYDDCAKFIGWSKFSKETYRIMINRLIRALGDKFKLIAYKTEIGGPARINLLDYDDLTKPFNPDPKKSFYIPGGLWEFGWAARLTRRAKYMYFISLTEASLNADKDGWWSQSQEYLYTKYHLSQRPLSRAILELQRFHLLKVRYGLQYPFRENSIPSKYKVLPLYSWQYLQDEIANLTELHGPDKVKKARERAGVVLEENNLEVIEKLINYSSEFGDDIVQYAVDQVSQKQIGNPKRSFIYIEGIILKHSLSKNKM